MNKICISFILCFSFLFLNAQNNSEVQILKQASQIIYNNSVAEKDINFLREVTKIIPEIESVTNLLVNKTYDKNLQKHIKAQTAIKNKIGELTSKKGYEYINVLYNLAGYHSNLANYENAQKLYEEAFTILNIESNSERKTKWEYIIHFAQILNRDFGRSSDDFMLLEEITTEIKNYLNSHSQDESDEIILLCINALMGGNMLQQPFDDYKNFYSKGKDLIVKSHGTQQEGFLILQSTYALILVNEGKFDESENIINQTIKDFEKLFGKENLLKSYELYHLSNIQMNKGDIQNAISTLEQSVTMLSKIFDESNINVLNLKRELANALLYTGKNGVVKAGKLLEEIAEQSKKNNGEISTQYISALEDQIYYYQFTENVESLRKTLKKAHHLAKEFSEKHKLDAGLILNNLFVYYRDINSFDEAITISDEAMDILKNIPKGKIDYANSLVNKCEIYMLTENFIEAEKCLNEAIPILKNSGNQQYYADGLTWLGDVYSRQNRKKEAEKTLKQAYQIYKKNSLENTKYFGLLLINYGNTLVQINKFKEAKEKFEEAIKLATETDNNFLLGNCYQNYSTLFYDQNDFKTAMEYLNKADTCYLKSGDNGILDHASILVDKNYIYTDLGQYNEAKNALTEVRNIIERMKGKTSYDYFQSIMSLYNLAYKMGNGIDMQNYIFDMTKAFYEQQKLANNDMNQMLNICNLVFPAMLNYVIELQIQTGINFKDVLATSIYEKDKKDFIAKYGQAAFDNSINTASLMVNNFGEWLLNFKTELENRNRYSKHVSRLLGDYYYSILWDDEKALKYYREFMDGQDKNSQTYAAGLHKLSQVYNSKGDYQLAAVYEKQCIDLHKKFVSDKSIDLSYPLYNLSFNYYKAKKYPQAFQAAKERFEILQPNISTLFNTMNENDRLALSIKYGTNARDIYDLLSVYPQDEVTQIAYNAALYYKGLLLRSSNQIRQSIYNSKNNDLISGYDQLIKIRKQLQSMPDMMSRYTAQDTVGYLEIRKLYERVDSLDWYLTQNSTVYRNAEQAKTPKWTDVRNNLKNNEAAIEFIISTDTTNNCNCQYGALILKKDVKVPIYVPMFNYKDLAEIISSAETKYSDKGSTTRTQDICKYLYLNRNASGKGKEMYDLIWKPIAEELDSTISTIYYSPVGMLYTIALSALTNENNKTLFDLYDLRLVSSTGYIVNQSNNISKIQNAQIYGGIRYDAVKERCKDDWKCLEGSKIESVTIDSIFKQHNLVSDLYTDLQATEDIVRKNNNNDSPSLLLFATHGYYAGEGMENNDVYRSFYTQLSNNQLTPMKRGGLVLSDANPVWHNEVKRPEENDGILLAEEIAELNLNNTDLAVLSACETGLGNVSETEGVFGLQRGFRLSGVKSIVMSLWRVHDEVGKEFMIEFFNYLLSGKEKHEAFRVTQQILRKKYPNNPYKWAVYVMLD